MKILKKIILTVAGLFAWIMIGVSDQMMDVDSPSYIYAALLIISVVYLHWALRAYLMPISQLPKAQANELRNPAHAKYNNGFNVGTAGVGYALLVFHVYHLFDKRFSDGSSCLSQALFLIAIGTFTKTRIVVANLCQVLIKNKK